MCNTFSAYHVQHIERLSCATCCAPTHTLKQPECIRVQIMCNTLSAYHVQHVVLQHIHSSSQSAFVCKSCATHWALTMCNMLCSNTYTQAARVHSCANHVQHIELLPCATCAPTHTLKQPECIRVQIISNTLSSYHVQHVLQHIHSSRTVCKSVTKFDRV